MKLSSLVILTSLGVFLSVPKLFALSPMKLMVTKDDQVQIKGYRGELEYIVDSSAKDIMVIVDKTSDSESSEWQFTLRREGEKILVQVDSPESKQVWSNILAKMSGQPKFNMTVKGPSLPTRINWHEGRFSTKNFNSSLHVNVLDGEIAIEGGEGELRVDSQNGQIKVVNWKGNTEIETYDGRVEVSGIEGDLRLDNFVGDSRVVGISGSVRLSSFKGDTRVSQIKGRLDFKNGNSPLHIDALEGELRGQSMQGPVFATVRGEANIRVESEEGPINLRLPQSGAWVNLGTAEGSLNVPGFLKLTRLPSQQIRTGKLRGNFGGSVFVRTTSGDIQLR